MRKHGQRVPILVKRGPILEGRHRYRACCEIGIEPRLQEYEGDDCLEVIYSHNLHRRHLNADQRAMLVAKLRLPQLRAEAREWQTAHLRKGDQIPVLPDSSKRESTRERLAEEARVTVHKAGEALRVVKNEKPHVVDDIIAGKRRIASVKSKPRKPRPKKERSFHDEVSRKFDLFVNRWPVTMHRQRKRELLVILLGRYESGKIIDPVSVTFADGKVEELSR